MVSAPDCSKDVVQLDGNGAERKESSNNHVGETGSTPKQRHSSTIFSPQWQKNPCFEIKKERSEQVHIFTDRISKRACGSNIARPAISPPLAHVILSVPCGVGRNFSRSISLKCEFESRMPIHLNMTLVYRVLTCIWKRTPVIAGNVALVPRLFFAA